jgi:raffinose/stachyose/melibiose transport system permease protein
MERIKRNKLVILALVSPGLIFFFAAVLYPIFQSVYYGMTDWKGVGTFHFVGMQNFITVLTEDKVFRESLLHAATLAVLTVALQHPVALFFAIIADRIGGRRETFFRAAFFIPCVISIVVIARMWSGMFNADYGLINTVLKLLSLDALKQDWLGNYHIALYSVVFVIMWVGFGYAFLIYYSGVKGIPEELYEAGLIDGFTGWQRFRYITLPLLKPVLWVNVTLAIVSSLKQMEPIYLMTNGGPGSTTQFVANYLYVQAFNAKKYGYANAISAVFVVVCLIVTVALQQAFKMKGEEDVK